MSKKFPNLQDVENISETETTWKHGQILGSIVISEHQAICM